MTRSFSLVCGVEAQAVGEAAAAAALDADAEDQLAAFGDALLLDTCR